MGEEQAHGERLPTVKRFLTVEQVCERLGVHRQTVYTYIREGRLRAVRVGRGWKIAPESLEAFLRGDTPQEAEKGGLAPALV